MSNLFVLFALLNNKITSLVKSNKTITSNISSLQSDVSDLQLDVSSLQTDVTALENKSILTAGITDEVTISTAGDNTLSIDKQIAKIGNNIILDNNKIKIAGDIDYVILSIKVQLTLKQNSGDIKNIYVQKNDTSVIEILTENYRTADKMRVNLNASDILIPVEQDDTIQLKGYFGVGDIIQAQSSRTYITVKEV